MPKTHGRNPNDVVNMSRFRNANERRVAVTEALKTLFAARSDTETRTAPTLDDEAQAVLNDLIGTLTQDPPRASQAAEAALTLAAFSLVEDRVLNLRDASKGDVNPNIRIDGDRAVGDRLCREVLAPRNIPATQGPFQSATYRSGYLAPQARNPSLRRYIGWQSEPGRTLDDVRKIAHALVDAFLDRASSMPPTPSLIADRFTFVAYRQARDALLADPSEGALEQYLLTGLLGQELSASSSALRAQTKNVGASDAASGAPGDIELREGQTLRGVIEVTAASWDDKLNQLEAVVKAHLSEATIAAPNVTAAVTGAELAEKVKPAGERLGLDVAVVDLHGLMDVAASRMSRAGRAAAFGYVYRCLASYHRRRPELAERLIRVLSELDLVSQDVIVPPRIDVVPDVGELMARVRELLASQHVINNPETPSALRELADQVEAAQEE
jgi:hypothetical protein